MKTILLSLLVPEYNTNRLTLRINTMKTRKTVYISYGNQPMVDHVNEFARRLESFPQYAYQWIIIAGLW